MELAHPHPAAPPGATDLSQRILRARIVKSFNDHCDLDLLDQEGDAVLAHGRLYQSDSAANKDVRLMAEIPGYQSGDILEAVFVRHLRQEEGKPLWFVHERWGLNNPWDELSLRDDDIVTGVVIREIPGANRKEAAGYLIQLDIGAPLECISKERGNPASTRMQQDIEVRLPIAEIPWADGTLGRLPANPDHNKGRLVLEVGDPIQALVFDVRKPPDDPRVSLVRLINHRDAHADTEFKHREVLALWRFRRLFGDGHAQADFDPATPANQDANARPYQGKRLLLVDDDEEALSAQAELLGLMGAEVAQVHVESGALSQAIDDTVATLRRTRFDLAFIDNNLPGRDLGQSLIEKVLTRLENQPLPRFILQTANAHQTIDEPLRVAMIAKGVNGIVHRPLSHRVLRRLLAGEVVWENETLIGREATAPGGTPSESSPFSLTALMHAVQQQAGVGFVMLFKAARRLQAGDLMATGEPPFGRGEYREVLARSDLHLLVESRIQQLDITAKDGGGNDLLRGVGEGSLWRRLNSEGAPWILGIGYSPGTDLHDRLPVWHTAIGAALEARTWHEWAEHVSGFVQLGLAHQGLSHEVFNLQGELRDELANLQSRFAKLGPGSVMDEATHKGIEDKICKIKRLNGDLLEFAKRQLRGQALRRRQVFLPEAIETIRRIAKTECLEAEVGLHVAAPLPLALPVAHASLVLPLVNLLINAAKHHYRAFNRRVELTFDLEEGPTEQTLLVEVRDNGPGMGATTLAKLWQAGHSSASDPDLRHGIGLWLSKRLVEETGGAMALQYNQRGLGTVFRLRYPIHIG